jgi:antitoxin component YwqK of YwqJK toxin-antitoxin module
MRLSLTIFILVFLFSCKQEYRKIIDTYSNGKIKVEYVYANKSNTARYQIIEYYPDGEISFKGTVENNKFVGVKCNYYENGELKQVDSLTRHCDLDFCCCDGKVLKYYSNGKPDQAFENRNGAANGLVHLYENDSSGRLGIIYTYSDDKKNGPYKRFYSSGQLYCSGTYRNDTLVGQVYYFKPNGDSLKINATWHGKEDFPSKKWLDNGEVFYATYLDNTYNKALYRWTDKLGKELRREIISLKTGGEWITAGGKWLTPN